MHILNEKQTITSASKHQQQQISPQTTTNRYRTQNRSTIPASKKAILVARLNTGRPGRPPRPGHPDRPRRSAGNKPRIYTEREQTTAISELELHSF